MTPSTGFSCEKKKHTLHTRWAGVVWKNDPAFQQKNKNHRTIIEHA
jgi:hypothetical protein